ncbi:lactococcin 972 family bacteriocin [Acidipropionibacterium virtanenii]|uniref:Lactococcin 972 family bacteriocin n=1 Tax=Acidipropionibacterium virtanenii TaxID=2057246 RepID=A0A344UQC0_9ACTN|nr:hypothetical protein JS278_00271 [Acidipropionibacterium virtanenii]
MKISKIRSALSVAAVAALLGAGLAPTAWASGAGGGNFTCVQTSSVPRVGHITSTYYHASRSHYATAKGRSYQTISAGAGKTAKAVAERASSGNACYWGFNS